MENEIKIIFNDNEILKPLKDNRKYKIISFSNEIECVLISDKLSLKSAFSMIIQVGYLNEFEDETDFSFFIIQKLVKENIEFNNLLKENCGILKTKINEDWTFIYFEIDSNAFINALNSLLNYFNINNLNEKNILKNERFIQIKKKSLINYPLFNNIQCKEKKICENFIEKIQNFYERNYTSNKIKFSLITKENIDEIQSKINNLFSNFKQPNKINNNIIEKNNNANKIVSLKCLEGMKYGFYNCVFYIYSISLFNPFVEYLIYMLKGSRPGSLEYDLKWRKYIDKINIYSYYSFSKGHEITLSMFISDFDVLNCENLIIKTLNFIESIKKKSNIQETYNDLKLINENKFKYLNINDYQNFLYDITFNLFSKNKDKNFIFQEYFFPQYDESIKQKIFEIFNNLLNDMMVIFLYPQGIFNRVNEFIKNSNKFSTNTETDFYLIGNINKNEINKAKNASYHWDQSMFLPKKNHNEFIIENNELIVKKEKEIFLYLNLTNVKIWYKYNTNSQIPIVYTYFHFEFPEIKIHNNPIQQKLNNYYVNHLIKKIELNLDDIKFSGNKIKIIYDENGINLKLKLYENIYIKIINQILNYIFNPNDFHEIGGIDYENRNYNSIKEKSLILLGCVLKKNYESLIDLDMNSNNLFRIYSLHIEKYAIEVSKKISIECFLYGYCSDNILNYISTTLQKYNNSNIFYKKKIENYEINYGNIFIYQIPFKFIEKNLNYLICFFQIGKRENLLDIYSSLFCNIFNSQNKEILFEKVYKDDIIYLRIIMNEINKLPDELLFKLENELIYFCERKFNEKEIINNLNYLKEEFNEKKTKKEFKSLWYEIYENKYDFKRYDNILKIINNFQITELINNFEEFIQNIILKKRREIIFMFYCIKKTHELNLKYFPEGMKIKISNKLIYINKLQ